MRHGHSATKPQSNTSGGEGRGMNGRGMKVAEPCSIPLPFIPLPISIRFALLAWFFLTRPRSGKSSLRARILIDCSAEAAKKICLRVSLRQPLRPLR